MILECEQRDEASVTLRVSPGDKDPGVVQHASGWNQVAFDCDRRDVEDVTVDDGELLRRAARGDEAAFDEKLMALAKRRDGHKPPIATDATKGKTIVES